MKLLKGEYRVTHGFANTISILYRQQAAGGPPPEEDLVDGQYTGAKAGLRPIYDAILNIVSGFGSDVEIAPKKSYVSLRRSRQFAIVKPATRDRIDLGLNLKGGTLSIDAAAYNPSVHISPSTKLILEILFPRINAVMPMIME